ncbi:MAG: hypothetical protein WCP07_06895, partial [bacterium]
GYTDSILMAFDGYEYFKSAGFDFLIRSDMDVFLTPLFSKWLPKSCNDFVVGGGAYSENFNRKRLKRIALDLGMEHAGADNRLGSQYPERTIREAGNGALTSAGCPASASGELSG